MTQKQHLAELLPGTPMAQLGEGPQWNSDEKLWWWVDIPGCQVHKYNPSDHTDESTSYPSMVGMVALADDGGLIIGLAERVIHLSSEGQETEILSLDDDLVRFNDGAVDCKGRLWIGTMALAPHDHSPLGKLYRTDKGGKVDVMAEDIGISNGIAWSPDNQLMYYVDSKRDYIAEYPFDPETGELGPERQIPLPEQVQTPDGMCCDSKGRLWLADYQVTSAPDGNGRVYCIDPAAGNIVEEVLVPEVQHVTCCAFGKDDELFITTARGKAAEPLPNGGKCFTCHVGVNGLPTFRAKLMG